MIVEVKNLQFAYSKNSPVVLDIQSFDLRSSEKVFLFGPSGCGKTTFLEAIAGVLEINEGSLKLSGHQLVKSSNSFRDKIRANHIGYIFQNFNLIPYLSVMENITLPLYFSPKRRKQVPLIEEKNKATYLAEKLGIADFLRKRVTELSVGQQQRVAAARAVIGGPELILADEPTSALDTDHREKFISLLFEICKENGTAVLFVSHDRSLMPLFDAAIDWKNLNIGSEK